MRSHPLKAFFIIATIAFAGLITTYCGAATIPLGDPVLLSSLLLTPNTNPSITVGDKKFDTFTFAATGDMPPAMSVNVIPIQDSDGNYGVRFQAAFIDLPGNGGSDALITYKVTVTDPEPRRIIDAHLVGNPNLLGTTGSVSVTETFMPDSALMMEIHDKEDGLMQSDSVDFPVGFRSLNVQKDILILGGDGAGTLSFVDQTFSQTALVVPEASAALMSVIGCIGLSTKRRRRNA